MNRHSPLLLTLLGFGFSQAHAQTKALEEVIVTADFRSSSLQDLATSASVLDAELIQRKNALHLEDILLNAPNVNVASGASRARFYQLRGIGERGQFSEPLNSSVGLLIDGVDFSGTAASALLYDIEQVEILMGPQGTRYGSNALAGLINVRSRRPGNILEYGVQLQAENYAGQGLGAYVSTPVTDTLSIRLAAQQITSDGFSNNLTLNRPTNTRDETSFKASAHWQISPELQIAMTLAKFDSNNGYDAFSLDNSRDTLSDEPGVDNQNTRLGSLRITSKQLETVTMEAYLGLARTESAYGYDEDWVYTGFHPWEYSSTDAYYRHHDTASAELRLLSTDASQLFNDRMQWVAGIYSLHQDSDLQRVYTYLPGPFSSNYRNRRLAVYADTTTRLTTHWFLEGGLRSERFNADYLDSDSVYFSPEENLSGGRIGLNFQPDDVNMWYLSASRGYKTGGFNTDGSVDADLREFGTESLWNYEAGYKGSLLDGSLQLQAALFWMDRRDVQISSSTTRVRGDGSAEFISYTGNAADGINRGLELNLRWALGDQVLAYSSVGLLHTEYQDFINAEGQDLSGREQAHAPGYQYTVGFTWNPRTDLTLDLNVQGRDAFYYSDSHDARSSNYNLLNTSVAYHWEQWRLSVWGRNLTDKDYAVRGYYFGNDPRNDYAATTYTQLAEPRRFGASLNYDF